MKKLIYLSCFLLSLSLPGQDRSHQLRQKLLSADREYIFVVAHRADWRNAPENSLEGIRSAIEMGSDIIEIDVRQTRDGELVLMHDETLDRTTSGKGKVSDWPLDHLKQLHLRNGLGRVTRFTIPTLREALLLAKGKILINLDKSYDYFDQIYQLTEETGTTGQVVIKARKPVAAVKAEFGQYLDKVLFMPIIDLGSSNAWQWIADYQKELNPVAMELVFADDQLMTDELANAIQKSGSRIWINSLWSSLNGGHEDDLALTDPDAVYGWMLSKKATLIQTDRPRLLLEYLKVRNPDMKLE